MRKGLEHVIAKGMMLPNFQHKKRRLEEAAFLVRKLERQPLRLRRKARPVRVTPKIKEKKITNHQLFLFSSLWIYLRSNT